MQNPMDVATQAVDEALRGSAQAILNDVRPADAPAPGRSLLELIREAQDGGEPDDHFERQARATLSQFAACRRELHAAKNVIERLRADDATARAQIRELERANAQLHEDLAAAREREAFAQERAGWLRGVIASAAATLAEGLRTNA